MKFDRFERAFPHSTTTKLEHSSTPKKEKNQIITEIERVENFESRVISKAWNYIFHI